MRRLLAAATLAAGGCPAPASTTKTAADAPPAHTVVFCADTDATKNPGLSDVASALNDALRAHFATDKTARVSPVNIADARAVVEECNPEPESQRCMSALAQLNHAVEVVVPVLAPSSRHGHGVRVQVVRFDAEQNKVLRTSAKSFRNAGEARGGVDALVAEIAGG